MAVVLTLKPAVEINEHQFAVEIAGIEGGVVNQPIAQIKETQKAILDRLGRLWVENPGGVVLLLKKHAPNP